MVEGSAATDSGRANFLTQQKLLASNLESALRDGYRSDELLPVIAAKRQLEQEPEPVWIGARAGLYRVQADREALLLEQLTQIRADLLDRSRQAATARLQEATAQIAEDAKLGAEEAELRPLRTDLDQADKRRQTALTVAQVRASAIQLEAIHTKASDIAAAQKVEQASIQQAADQLRSQPLDVIVKAGQEALASARNDAVAGTWLQVGGLDRPYRLLEKYGSLIGSAGQDQTVMAAAAVRRYADQIHQAVLNGVPSKAIVLSIAEQSLTAYQAGKVVRETYVTTGRPPDLATDIGPMKVLRKDSPWKMHSPWPKSSPYWYPDAVVQRVVWFTVTGEGLHDAPWQPAGTYGPGSQYGPSASHGCVHLPPQSEIFFYDWADAGTPVVVIPGGGRPLVAQLAEKTTDDQGNPLTGPKGA